MSFLLTHSVDEQKTFNLNFYKMNLLATINNKFICSFFADKEENCCFAKGSSLETILSVFSAHQK
jgi:hypothetical protein